MGVSIVPAQCCSCLSHQRTKPSFSCLARAQLSLYLITLSLPGTRTSLVDSTVRESTNARPSHKGFQTCVVRQTRLSEDYVVVFFFFVEHVICPFGSKDALRIHKEQRDMLSSSASVIFYAAKG